MTGYIFHPQLEQVGRGRCYGDARGAQIQEEAGCSGLGVLRCGAFKILGSHGKQVRHV